jgi:mRNA interferase MazF
MEQILKRKDILLVPFPYSDQSGSKRRPALVISHDSFNKDSMDLLLCAMTSNLEIDRYTTLVKKDDWKDGEYSESCIKASTIITVDKNIIIKRIGRLSSERFKEVIQKVNEIIK